MRRFTLLGLLISINLVFFSQVSSEKRIEFSLKEDFRKEFVKPIKNNGLVVISSSKEKSDGDYEWKFDLYNTNLEVSKSTSIFLDKKMYRSVYFSTDDNFYLLFINNKRDYRIINFDCKTGEIQTTEGELPKKASIQSITILDEYAFLQANLKNSPLLFSIELNSGIKTIIPINIPGVKPKKTKISNVQLLKNSNELFVFIDANINKKNEKHVLVIDESGRKKDLFSLNKNTEQNIIEVSATKISDNEYIYSGTYSNKNPYVSEGIFISKTNNTKVDFIKFYNFNELNNFFSFLSVKRQEKIEKKKARKEKKGKELVIRYFIEGHDIIKKNNNYYFVGEAYYATYRTETYTTFVNGRSVTQTRQVFDGYQYTHGIVTGFDNEGKLLWNNTFKMWPYQKPFIPKKFISISDEKTNIEMAFADRDSIVSMGINYNGEIVKENKASAIETEFESDETKYSNANLDYWYENYFIAYGEQKIKNKTGEAEKKKRYVYFINKIKF